MGGGLPRTLPRAAGGNGGCAAGTVSWTVAQFGHVGPQSLPFLLHLGHFGGPRPRPQPLPPPRPDGVTQGAGDADDASPSGSPGERTGSGHGGAHLRKRLRGAVFFHPQAGALDGSPSGAGSMLTMLRRL
eukprot:7385889-Prymnesium_polylepis.1